VAQQHYQLDFARNLLILSWLCSIVSSYFAGKKQDAEAASTVKIGTVQK
jgi:hypothetical protein